MHEWPRQHRAVETCVAKACAAAGFREEAGVLQVCARAEMARVSGAFSGRNATRVGSRVASPREAVHRVRWLGANASDPTNGAWLAHAGAEGLLRCQYLDFS